MLAVNQHANLTSGLNLMYLVSFQGEVHAASKICTWGILTLTPTFTLLSNLQTSLFRPSHSVNPFLHHRYCPEQDI